MKRKKSKKEELTDHHRWLVSYADFITLLFAFFVVMYAMSSVNTSKYESLSEGMKSAFSKDKEHLHQSMDKEGVLFKNIFGTYQDGLDDINHSLSELEDKNYTIKREDGWIELDIKSGALFQSGDADLRADALVKLMRLAAKLKASHAIVSIEGYTDNVPIETPQYPSNWELSATRAAAVGRILNGYGIPTERLMVTGYGEQYPIADNMTEEGRGANRRVSIIIAVNRKAKRLMNPALRQIPHSVVVGNKGVK